MKATIVCMRGTRLCYGFCRSSKPCARDLNGLAVTHTAKGTPLARDILSENPFRFSSEVHDNSLGLVYYNYRHYNPKDGRWLGRDPLEEEDTIVNLYLALRNNPSLYDLLGMVLPTLGGPSAMQDSITYDPSRPPPPPPETWETWIPVYGSIRGMDYAFYNGHYVQGTFELGMTLADMALVEQIVLGLGNGCWKIGSHTWSATRKWYGRLRDLPKGTHVHHQFIHRNGPVGKHIPDWIKNQPWNLNPIYSQSIRGRSFKSSQLHSIIHGASTEARITVFDLWNVQYSTGAKAFQIFTSLHVIETIMFEKEDDADAVYLNGKRLE